MGTYGRNLKYNFVAQIIKIIASFIVSVIVSRVLGPTGKGYIAFLILIIDLIANYGSLGIINATNYFQKRENYSEEHIYHINNSYLIVVWLIISLVILGLYQTNIILTDYSLPLIILALFYIVVNFLKLSLNAFYVGNEKIKEINNFLLLSSFISIILTIIAWRTNYLNVNTYFIILFIESFFNLVFLIAKTPYKFRFKLDFTLLKREFLYGINPLLANLFVYLNYRLDQYLIKIMHGNYELGIYVLAVSLVELVLLIPQSVMNPMTGKLYNLPVESEERRTITIKTLKYGFYICLILSIIGMACIPLIPFVYTTKYNGSKIICFILFVSISFVGLGKMATPYFYSSGNVKVITWSAFISFLINAVLNFMLIPSLKGVGAALASTISYLVYGLFYVFYFSRYENIKPKEILLFDKGDIEYIKKHILKSKKVFRR